MAGQEADDIDPPKTAAHALDLAISDGATALISCAVLLAVDGEVLPQALFVAALAVGWTDAPSSASVSNGVGSVRQRADTWLYEWFAKTAGPDTVNQLVRDEVGDKFPFPLPPGWPRLIVSQASKLAAGVRLSPAAGALLGRASRFAWRIQHDHRYGVRHIVASLILPDANRANAGIEDLVYRRSRIRLADDATLIMENASRGDEPDDAVKVWQEIIKDPPSTLLPGAEMPEQPPPTARPFITLSGFTSDGVAMGDADPLGIVPDVRAFARLICLEEATPPLSICLFGEWGSGKSTFMERLQLEIATLTRPKPAGKPTQVAPTADEEPKFVENVVQIKFNAWHFADASLWASLTAVFFDQLRRGGSDNGNASNYKALIGKVADKVRSLEAGAANALEKVEYAKRKSDTAHKALDTAEKQLEANDLTLAWTQLQLDLEHLQATNADRLKEVGRRVYRDDLSTDTKAFAMAVAEAASTPGRVKLIGRVLVSGGWSTWLGAIAIALIAVIGIALPLSDPTIDALWFQRIAGWGAGTFAALGALWQAFKSAKPILDGTWKYAKAVEVGRAELTQEAENKRQEARAAADNLNDAETALADARVPLSDYLDGVQKDAPSTILRYFLFEDGDVRDYDNQVGIVSRARRSFEQLDSIVRTTRMHRKVAEAKRANDAELSPEEQALLAPVDGKGLHVPDRIILYIDDLDRCTHDQVYAVLQAIHLLLAFELFVVVVGVDVRWIEGAVAKHFEMDTLKLQDGDQEKFEILRRKRAIDYLEKIFQIPFWLERLNTESRGGSASAGGSYAAYVRELLKDKKRRKPGTNIFKPILSSGELLPGAEVSPSGNVSVQLNEANTATFDDPIASPEGEFGAVDAALASLKLEQREIDFLASPEIGAIASKSPRAVKRLINVYRIVRARLSDHELDAFLGRSGASPHYPVAALLAAIETGQPVELAEQFYPALKLVSGDARLNFIWTAMDRNGSDKSREATEALLGIRSAFPALGAAFSAVDRLCGEQGASVGSYLEMARLVRRYSFNRFG